MRIWIKSSKVLDAIISRFAPAPTGFLHLGHVVNAIFVWAIADRVLLRIEDHDRQRSRAEYDAEIVADLAWLGFEWDGDITRQSARGDIYSQALDRLRAQGLVYACACSRRNMERAANDVGRPASVDVGRAFQARRRGPERAAPHQENLAAPHQENSAPPYPGTCRDRGIPEGPGVGVRVRLEPSVEGFVDLRHGPQEQRPFEQCGDLLVRDREGNWTYQFAATVDDLEQGITHVIRGDDLVDSTGRQIQLARLLGRETPPVFLHHPLIMKSATQKLSKSDRDTGVRDLRAGGWSAARVIGQAAFLAGLISKPRDVRADRVSSIITP
jgi:glutamyl/glutaminyl-tRNA synthetase